MGDFLSSTKQETAIENRQVGIGGVAAGGVSGNAGGNISVVTNDPSTVKAALAGGIVMATNAINAVRDNTNRAFQSIDTAGGEAQLTARAALNLANQGILQSGVTATNVMQLANDINKRSLELTGDSVGAAEHVALTATPRDYGSLVETQTAMTTAQSKNDMTKTIVTAVIGGIVLYILTAKH